MNVPKLRFPEFKDEWKQVDLSQIFTYFSTNSLSRDQLLDIGIIKNIHYGDIHRKFSTIVDVEKDVVTYIKDANYKNKYELCKNNDLIFADASEDYEGIGKAIEIINVNNETISGLHTILARDIHNIFASKFKGYYFNSPVIHHQIRVFANGFKVYGISKDLINKLNANIPTIYEQEKIANTLSLLDKKIELQSKKIEDLKLFKKGLINELIKKDIKWNKYKVENIFSITRGTVIPKDSLSFKNNSCYCYSVYSSQTSNDGILGFDKTYDFDGKYLTWTTDGANAGKVFLRSGKFRCTNVCGVLYNENNSFVNELTVEILNLVTPKHVSYVGNPKLMNNVMANIEILLPSKEISEYYSFVLSLVNKDINLNLNKARILNQLKRYLLQVLFV